MTITTAFYEVDITFNKFTNDLNLVSKHFNTSLLESPCLLVQVVREFQHVLILNLTSVYHKFFESNINIIKLYIRHSEERLVEWSKAHYFDVLIHQYTSCEFESRLRFFFYFYYQYSQSFHHFHEMKKVSIILLFILTRFIQLNSVITHAQ